MTSASAFGTLPAVIPKGTNEEGPAMIIDAHAHYTSAPPELQAYRARS